VTHVAYEFIHQARGYLFFSLFSYVLIIPILGCNVKKNMN
jgi:hypothetical protein